MCCLRLTWIQLDRDIFGYMSGSWSDLRRGLGHNFLIPTRSTRRVFFGQTFPVVADILTCMVSDLRDTRSAMCSKELKQASRTTMCIHVHLQEGGF